MVLCRKYGSKVEMEDSSMEFTRKTDEVISYLDSLIRHWKLEEKIKIHCDHISKAMLNSTRAKTD